MESILTAEIVRNLFVYESDIGLLFWRVNRGTAKIGAQAGTKNGNGYKQVKIFGKIYFCHRLAWLHFYGKWPIKDIDHINRIKTDNRIVNLREVTHSENMRNRGLLKTNKSGYQGVLWSKLMNRWRACICVNNKIKHIGFYETAEEAALAYAKECEKIDAILSLPGLNGIAA